jgi:hypothetical protein
MGSVHEAGPPSSALANDEAAKRKAAVDALVTKIEEARDHLVDAGRNEAVAEHWRRRIAALKEEAARIAGDAGVPLGRTPQCQVGDSLCSDL